MVGRGAVDSANTCAQSAATYCLNDLDLDYVCDRDQWAYACPGHTCGQYNKWPDNTCLGKTDDCDDSVATGKKKTSCVADVGDDFSCSSVPSAVCVTLDANDAGCPALTYPAWQCNNVTGN